MPNEMFGPFRPRTPVPPRKPAPPSSWMLVDEDLKSFIKQHVGAGRFDPTKSENKLPNMQLRKTDMEFMLESALRQNVASLQRELPDFADYPVSGRKGLVDLEYNIGPTKFNSKTWPKFFDAVHRRDWETAAQESHRITPNEERNTNTKNALLDAAVQDRRRQRR